MKVIDRCVMCNEVIPEGRQICPNCEASALADLGHVKNNTNEHSYFVAYLALTDEGKLIGQVEVNRTKEVKTYKDILDMANCLSENLGFKKVIVLNYVKIERDDLDG